MKSDTKKNRKTKKPLERDYYKQISESSQKNTTITSLSSKFDQIKVLIRSLYPDNQLSQISFTSKDILELYHFHVGPNISQSTVSTYLYRLVKIKFLVRAGNKKDYTYRLKKDRIKEIPYYSTKENKFLRI